MNSDTLFCIWILVFPISRIEFSTPRIWSFLLYFSSLQDFWLPSKWNSLVHNTRGEIERCEKRAFQLPKMRKKKFSWNIKTKCITDLLLTVKSSRMKDYTCNTRWAHNRQTFTLISKKKWELGNFFIHVTGYVNTKKSNPNCMFVQMISWKCVHHIYFTFPKNI